LVRWQLFTFPGHDIDFSIHEFGQALFEIIPLLLDLFDIILAQIKKEFFSLIQEIVLFHLKLVNIFEKVYYSQ
jgi:hypothetical protein